MATEADISDPISPIKIEVEDKEYNSGISKIASEAVEEKIESGLSPPLEIKNMQVVNESIVKATEGDNFFKTPSDIDGKVEKNTEEIEMNSIEKINGSQNGEKIEHKTDETLTTEATLAQQDLSETSFKGEDDSQKEVSESNLNKKLEDEVVKNDISKNESDDVVKNIVEEPLELEKIFPEKNELIIENVEVLVPEAYGDIEKTPPSETHEKITAKEDETTISGDTKVLATPEEKNLAEIDLDEKNIAAEVTIIEKSSDVDAEDQIIKEEEFEEPNVINKREKIDDAISESLTERVTEGNYEDVTEENEIVSKIGDQENLALIDLNEKNGEAKIAETEKSGDVLEEEVKIIQGLEVDNLKDKSEHEEPLEFEQSFTRKNESEIKNIEMLVTDASEEIPEKIPEKKEETVIFGDTKVLEIPEEKNLVEIELDEKNGAAEVAVTSKSDDDLNDISPLVEEEVQIINENSNQVPILETKGQDIKVPESEEEGKFLNKVIQMENSLNENADDQIIKKEEFEEPDVTNKKEKIEEDVKTETLTEHATEYNFEDMTNFAQENETLAKSGEEEELSTPEEPENKIKNDTEKSEEIYEEKMENTEKCVEKAETISLIEVKPIEKSLEEASIVKPRLPEHEIEKEDLEKEKNLDTESESNAQDVYETIRSPNVEESDANEIEKIIREVPEELSEAINHGDEEDNNVEIDHCLSSEENSKNETKTQIQDEKGLKDSDAVFESKDRNIEEIHETKTSESAEKNDEISENFPESLHEPKIQSVEEIESKPPAEETQSGQENEELKDVPETVFETKPQNIEEVNETRNSVFEITRNDDTVTPTVATELINSKEIQLKDEPEKENDSAISAEKIETTEKANISSQEDEGTEKIVLEDGSNSVSDYLHEDDERESKSEKVDETKSTAIISEHKDQVFEDSLNEIAKIEKEVTEELPEKASEATIKSKAISVEEMDGLDQTPVVGNNPINDEKEEIEAVLESEINCEGVGTNVNDDVEMEKSEKIYKNETHLKEEIADSLAIADTESVVQKELEILNLDVTKQDTQNGTKMEIDEKKNIADTTGSEATILGENKINNDQINAFNTISEIHDLEVDGTKLEEIKTAENIDEENLEAENPEIPAVESESLVHSVEEIHEIDTSPMNTKISETEKIEKEMPEVKNQVHEAGTSDEITPVQNIENENQVEKVQPSPLVFLSGEESHEREAFTIENTEDGNIKKENIETVEESDSDVVKAEEAKELHTIFDSKDNIEEINEIKASLNSEISGAEEIKNVEENISAPRTLNVEESSSFHAVEKVHEIEKIEPSDEAAKNTENQEMEIKPTSEIIENLKTGEDYKEVNTFESINDPNVTGLEEISEIHADEDKEEVDKRENKIDADAEEIQEAKASESVTTFLEEIHEIEATASVEKTHSEKVEEETKKALEEIPEIDREIVSNQTFFAPIASSEATSIGEIEPSEEAVKDFDISSENKFIRTKENSVEESKFAENENEIEAREIVTAEKTVLNAESESLHVEEIHEAKENPIVEEDKHEKVENIENYEIAPASKSKEEKVEEEVSNSSSVFLSSEKSPENETTIIKNIENDSSKLEETIGTLSQVQNIETREMTDAYEVKDEKAEIFDKTNTNPAAVISNDVKIEEETKNVAENIEKGVSNSSSIYLSSKESMESETTIKNIEENLEEIHETVTSPAEEIFYEAKIEEANNNVAENIEKEVSNSSSIFHSSKENLDNETAIKNIEGELEEIHETNTSPAPEISDEIKIEKATKNAAENIEEEASSSSSIFLSSKESLKIEVNIKKIEDDLEDTHETETSPADEISDEAKIEEANNNVAENIEKEVSNSSSIFLSSKEILENEMLFKNIEEDHEDIHETETSPAAEISDEVKIKEETKNVAENIEEEVTSSSSVFISSKESPENEIAIKNTEDDLVEIHETDTSPAVEISDAVKIEETVKNVAENIEESMKNETTIENTEEDLEEIHETKIIPAEEFSDEAKIEETNNNVAENIEKEVSNSSPVFPSSLENETTIKNITNDLEEIHENKTSPAAEISDEIKIEEANNNVAEKILDIQGIDNVPADESTSVLKSPTKNADMVTDIKYSAADEHEEAIVSELITGSRVLDFEKNQNETNTDGEEDETKIVTETTLKPDHEDAADIIARYIFSNQTFPDEKKEGVNKNVEETDIIPVEIDESRLQENEIEKIAHQSIVQSVQEIHDKSINVSDVEETKSFIYAPEPKNQAVEDVHETEDINEIDQETREFPEIIIKEIIQDSGSVSKEEVPLFQHTEVEKIEEIGLKDQSSEEFHDRKTIIAAEITNEPVFEPIHQGVGEIINKDIDPIDIIRNDIKQKNESSSALLKDQDQETVVKDGMIKAEGINKNNDSSNENVDLSETSTVEKSSSNPVDEKCKEDFDLEYEKIEKDFEPESENIHGSETRIENTTEAAQEIQEIVSKESLAEQSEKSEAINTPTLENMATEATRSIKEELEVTLRKPEDKLGDYKEKDGTEITNIHEIEKEKAENDASDFSSSKDIPDEELSEKSEFTVDEKNNDFIIDPASIIPSAEEHVEKLAILPTANNQEAIGDVIEHNEITKEQITKKEYLNEEKEKEIAISSKDFQVIPEDQSAEKQVEFCEEEKLGEKIPKTKEKTTPNDQTEVSSSDILNKPADQENKVTEEEKTEAEEKEKEKENAIVEEDKTDEDEEDENKKADSGSDAPVMVEASRDFDIKTPNKKSHNILSGVGSKVKHSIAKVKKAITGKSSHKKEDKKEEAAPLL